MSSPSRLTGDHRSAQPDGLPVTPARSRPARLLIGGVRAYRFALSPWLGSACRFEPSCSAYALEALARHGAGAGSALVIGRIARCQPWCAGGHDPVPAEPPRLFRTLLGAGPAPIAASAPTPGALANRHSDD